MIFDPLIACASVGFAIMAWSQMEVETRRIMAGWFWLMLCVGAVAATAWTWASSGTLHLPIGPAYHDNWN